MIINILLCDIFEGLLPDYIPSYEWMFKKLIDEAAPGNEYKTWRTFEGELPTRLNTYELYIITGCNDSVYDDKQWIKELLDWIRTAEKAKTKIVGICFGHQAVAYALGGRVERSKKGWGAGIRLQNVVDERYRGFFKDGQLSLLCNHHDQVVRLPQAATRIATSEFCENESFEVGDNIITFQGHPEYMVDYEKHLIDNFAADEPESVKQKALQSFETNEHRGLEVAKFIMNYWTKK